MNFRASNWFDTKKNCVVYGIQGKIDPRKWLNCCKGKDPLIFDSEKDRDNYLIKLQKDEIKRLEDIIKSH